MAAIVFVATFVPKIPIPLGYAHLGDAAIFLIVFVCGRKIGILSGMIGVCACRFIGRFSNLDFTDDFYQSGNGRNFLQTARQKYFYWFNCGEFVYDFGLYICRRVFV